MLQISNLEDGKSDWNLNETHIIIPMIDGEVISNKDGDKIAKNTITLNTLDGTEQNILTNAMEHTLVIGLDRSLFDSYSNKGDLLVIQNSDLKLLPSNNDPRNSISYTLSFIDQPKNDVLWESPSAREKTKPEWCDSDDKTVEIKDVINYDEPLQDPPKHWQQCTLEKNSQPIILDGIHNLNIAHQQTKVVATEVSDESDDVKKPQKESHYIVGYYPTVQPCETLSVMSEASVLSIPKNEGIRNNSTDVMNSEPIVTSDANLNHLLVHSSMDDTWGTSKWVKSEPREVLINEVRNSSIINGREATSVLKSKLRNVKTALPNTTKHILVQNERTKPVITVSNFIKDQVKTEDVIKEASLVSLGVSLNKCDDSITLHDSSSLPEKSLPLKKKAKMKSSGQLGDSVITSSVRRDNTSHTMIGDEPRGRATSISTHEQQKEAKSTIKIESDSDSDEPLIKGLKKSNENQRKRQKSSVIHNRDALEGTTTKKIKLNGLVGSVESTETNLVKSVNVSLGIPKIGAVNSWDITCKTNFKTIFDVIEYLKRKKYLNNAASDILTSGLAEMKADILKEMLKGNSNRSAEYSTQLKAFALMVHFKQPAAFNHLKDIFGDGWPSLSIIKSWKRLLNSHRKPSQVNFKTDDAHKNKDPSELEQNSLPSTSNYLWKT